MNQILKGALAIAAVAVCTPATAWTVYPDTDFEWYASVGKNTAPYEAFPAARAGFIWSPGHFERRGWVPGHWIQDTYFEQVAIYSAIPAADPNPTIAVYRADGSLVVMAPLPTEITVR